MNLQIAKDSSSRALKEASARKAKKITFYHNGKPFETKLPVSIIPGKDFSTFDQLCQFLTEKSQLLNGVQYIFTLNGKRVNTLEELEHDQSYVISGTKYFQAYPYGLIKPSGPRISKISDRYKFFREEDLRLLRPLSSKYNNVYASSNRLPPLPARDNRDNRVVTVVNNRNHSIVSKVFLNLRTPKSFELLLRDLGQAVQLQHPKRMFTSSGQRIISVSQLKHELKDVNLFYLDSESPREAISLYNKSHSIESIEYEPKNLRPMISYSSDVDLRHDQFVPDTSLSSAVDYGKQPNTVSFDSNKWQKTNRQTKESIPTRIPSLKVKHNNNTDNGDNKQVKLIPIQLPPADNPSTPITNPSSPRCSQSKDIPIHQPFTISREKNEQIQRYVEKLLSDASNQITAEDLMIMSSILNSKPAPIIEPLPEEKEEIFINGTLNSLADNKDLIIDNEVVSGKRSPLVLTDLRKAPVSKNPSPSRSLKSNVSSKQSLKSERAPPKKTPNTSSRASKSESRSSKSETKSDSEKASKVSSRSSNEYRSRSEPKKSSTRASKNDSRNSTESNNKRPTPPAWNSSRRLSNPRSETKSEPRFSRADRWTPKVIQTSPSVRSINTDQSSRASKISVKSKALSSKPKVSLMKRSPSKSPTPTVAGELKEPKVNHEQFLRKGANIPDYCLQLDKIFSYNGNKCKNLMFINTGELTFHSGVFAVLWNVNTGKQRFYSEHDNDILSMRVDKKNEFIATSQLMSGLKLSMIRIWSTQTLATIAILTDSLFQNTILDMEFTSKNSLFVVSHDDKLNISLWNWKDQQLISSTSKRFDEYEEVFGGTVHPVDNDLLVTYGKMHLVVWHLKRDKSMDCRTALQTHSKINKTIHCADFLGDNSLLTGDSNGFLTIWAPFETNGILEFAIKEVKGHESQLTCFKLTSENILISGDSAATIKTWDVNDGEFRLLNAVKLPSMSGSVSSITLPSKIDDNMDIYVGTSASFILKGSALQTTSYEIVFEGHCMAIRTLSFDSRHDTFYTASLDQKVCKWDRSGMIWKSDSDVQGISSSVHPDGQVLAIGSANGIISIINTVSGEIMQHLQITEVCIGCLAFSFDGNFLVAGCQDGNLHVLPVKDNGFSYNKVSILKGPLPILTLQWSMDTQFILTSVDDNNYQELILWDLPNTRYIRNVTNFSDNLKWYNATCSGLEDATGTWDNDKLHNVINICKHYSSSLKFIVTGDENGFVRLFSYPCFDIKAAFFEYQQGGGSVTDIKISPTESIVVSCNYDGMILIWKIKEYKKQTGNTPNQGEQGSVLELPIKT